MQQVQSIIFPKDQFTLGESVKWLKSKDYKTSYKGKGVDITPTSYRFRQLAPLTKSELKDGFYYTSLMHKKKNGKGITFVLIHSP